MNKKALKLALDYIVATNKSSGFWLVPASNLNNVVTAIKESLAQPAWVSLTDEEKDNLLLPFGCYWVIEAIEAKLKEKNGV